ncbi:MAG: 2-amino-4-hydroxy-6-hydroxymethyldihydropteridine diphosphokinase [Candidatus Caenarcaniphilales bacterium]|nr:2-amino-4-hydroxy-6-hydroxymethyldihydropteridine diphosphokinase [Candidatus Caenarcaniphilales bacterium]
MSQYKTAYLALGSNLGDKFFNIYTALKMLKGPYASSILIEKVSNVYLSLPFQMTVENSANFLNIVSRVKTTLSPEELIQQTRSVEESLGKNINPLLNQVLPRVIDIDLLFYEGVVSTKEDLLIPHPRIFERDFVFVPLGEIIDRDWKDPVDGLSFIQNLERRNLSRKMNFDLKRIFSLSLQDIICLN